MSMYYNSEYNRTTKKCITYAIEIQEFLEITLLQQLFVLIFNVTKVC